MSDPIESSAHGKVIEPSKKSGRVTTGASTGTLLTADETRKGEKVSIRSPFRDGVRRFSQNWAAVIALIIVVLLILGAIFAPFLHTLNPTAAPDYNALSQGPSAAHWFGTDAEGRDQYSRILYGLRVPLFVGFVGTIITLAIGISLGLSAGYFGGLVDSLASRFTDFMFAFPAFLFAIILVTLFGSAFDATFPGGVGRAIILTLVFSFVSWPPLMRFVRSLALSMKETQFIEAARTVGTSNFHIVTRHLAPNVWGVTLVQASFLIANIIGTEAVLSIIGLGVNEPVPDLGTMLYDGAGSIEANAWIVFFPSLFLTVIILAFTFLGDGVRDAVDPRANQ